MVLTKNASKKTPRGKVKKKVTFEDPLISHPEEEKAVIVKKAVVTNTNKKKIQTKSLNNEDDDDDYIPIEESNSKKEVVLANTKKSIVRIKANQSSKQVSSTSVPDIKNATVRSYETHCRPSAITDLVSKLTTNQKKDVEEIGFGGLLLVNMTKFYTHLVPWLVDHFNPSARRVSCSLEKGFDVTKDDIFDVFELPKGNLEVNVIKKMKKTKNPDDSFMDEIKNKFGLGESDVLTTSKLGVFIENLKDGGDDFKKLFVLYVMSVFLTPTANGHVDLYLSKAVADVTKIVDTDWCSYVLKTLCEGIQKCQKKNSTRVMGCVLALQIIYFHRFMFRGDHAPTKLPLIQHWTDKLVSERLLEEKKAGFGICSIDQKTYPLSKKKKKEKKKKWSDDDPSTPSTGCASKIKETTSSFVGRILQIQLPDHLLTDEEIKLKSKDECHETFLMLQRDLELISLRHIKRLNELRKSVEEKEMSDSQGLSQILSDPTNLEYIDSVVEKFLSMKKVSDDMPSFELLSQTEDQGGKTSNDVIDKGIKKVVNDLQKTHDAHDFENNDDLLSYFFPITCPRDVENNDDPIEFISFHMSRNKEVMKSLPRLQQEVVDYSLLEIMPVDSNDEDFKKLNLHHLEIVFQFGENVVYRDDMRSMEFCQEVSSGVIIAWAALLNDMEKKQRHPKSRFFFGMHHSFFFQQLINDRNERNEAELDTIRQKLRNNLKSWITENNCLYHIKSSKMIFIPMLMHNHYFCVVVNFDLKLLQYLDNRKYTDSDKAIFMSYAQMMVDELSVVMDNLVDRRWIEVHSYECKIVNFGWMSKALNSDCGVFLMLHMLFFKGFEFKADFDKAMRRRVYRTAIAAAIILSDRNGVRQEILSKLKAFNGKKKNIQLMMLEKKKKRKQEEKEKREEEEKEKKKQKS